EIDEEVVVHRASPAPALKVKRRIARWILDARRLTCKHLHAATRAFRALCLEPRSSRSATVTPYPHQGAGCRWKAKAAVALQTRFSLITHKSGLGSGPAVPHSLADGGLRALHYP